MGVEDVFDSMQERKDERELKTEVNCELKERMARICRIYEDIELKHPAGPDTFIEAGRLLRPISVTKDIIYEFCRRLVLYEDKKTHFRSSGVFLSALIQKAYDVKENDFVLELGHLTTPLSGIGSSLMGFPEKKLRVTVKGAAGYYTGSWARDCSFEFQGPALDFQGSFSEHSSFVYNKPVGDNSAIGTKDCSFVFMDDTGELCGSISEYSSFVFHAAMGNFCASCAKYCSFTFEKTVGIYCGKDAKHSCFTFNDNAYNAHDCGFYSEHCTFFSPHREILDAIDETQAYNSKFFLQDLETGEMTSFSSTHQKE